MTFCVILAIADCFTKDEEDWYSFDELRGHAVMLKKNFPIEHEFTGWTMLVHVIDEKGNTHLFKTSTVLYKILDENVEYNFFTRDGQIWKVIEVKSKLTFKAK